MRIPLIALLAAFPIAVGAWGLVRRLSAVRRLPPLARGIACVLFVLAGGVGLISVTSSYSSLDLPIESSEVETIVEVTQTRAPRDAEECKGGGTPRARFAKLIGCFVALMVGTEIEIRRVDVAFRRVERERAEREGIEETEEIDEIDEIDEIRKILRQAKERKTRNEGLDYREEL